MDTTISNNQKNVAALVHLSTFSKYLFPFANFIAPLLIWTFNKDKRFIDEHGRQALNFQLSMFLYTLIIGMLCLPLIFAFATNFVSFIDIVNDSVHSFHIKDIDNYKGYFTVLLVMAVILFGLFVLELYAVITATIQANKGDYYKYPLSIPFIKKSNNQNQSENEHVS